MSGFACLKLKGRGDAKKETPDHDDPAFLNKTLAMTYSCMA